MNMRCYHEGGLKFGIFNKKVNQWKYAGKESTHINGTLHATQSGVLNRLEKFTPQTPKCKSKSTNSVYPNQDKSPQEAGPALSIFPTRGYLRQDLDNKRDFDKRNDPNTEKQNNRNICFCVSYSRYFFMYTHRETDRIKNSSNISLLRVQMPYHRFNNLSKLLNRDLATKLGQETLYRDLRNI